MDISAYRDQFLSFLKQPRNEWLLIVCLGLLVFVNFAIKVNSWELAYFSDEWEFFNVAKQISSGEFAPNIFNLDGVYGENPYLGSYYQAAFLFLLGATPLVWKLSGGILLIPVIVFFFYWVKSTFSPTLAWVATILFSSSHVLANYSKIGYPNHLAFCLFIICLFIIQRLVQTRKPVYFALLGLLWGVSFYVFIGPLFPIMQFPLLLPLLNKYKRENIKFKKILRDVGGFLIAYVLMVLPGILVTDITHWQNIQNVLGRGGNPTGLEIVGNVIRPLYMFLLEFYPPYAHFSGGRFVGPLVALLILIGIVIALKKALKHEAYVYLMLFFLSTGIVIGISSMYEQVGITRGEFMLPVWFVLGGIAAVEIFRRNNLIAIILVLFITVYNVYFAHVGYFQKSCYHVYNLLLKELQSTTGNVVYVYPDNQPPRGMILDDFLSSYGVRERFEAISISEFGEDDLRSTEKVVYLGGDEDIKEKIENRKDERGIEWVKLNNYYFY